MWSTGPVGEAATGDSCLVSLLSRGGVGEPDGQIVTVPIVCRYCDWDQFEVAAGECHCVGCCLPLGVQDGDVYPGASMWELVPSGTPFPGSAGGLLTPADMVGCPAGHDVFQVAVAYTLAADGRVRRLSVGLRCPVDGALRLYIDNARVQPRTV